MATQATLTDCTRVPMATRPHAPVGSRGGDRVGWTGATAGNSSDAAGQSSDAGGRSG